MVQENAFVTTAARVASLPFRLFGRRPFQPPEKALILKPCCLSRVLLTTPLLAALAETYPRAQFDWALNERARAAVATNPRLSELVDSGRVGLPEGRWQDVRALAERLRERAYDTCIIPDCSSTLALVAWLARIPQRVGLSGSGRGFSHTLAVRPPDGTEHAAAVYLSIARSLGVETPAGMEFYPSDGARAAMTRLLVDELEWLGEEPLVLLHPGGGDNPWRREEDRRWPVERFVLLGSQLVRQHQSRLLIVGAEADRPLANAVGGMISAPVVNLAGQVDLVELGALCEVADLYVGNDTGPTHVAAAVGCPTLAIFGPTDPARSGPYAAKGKVVVLWHEFEGAFSWEAAVTVEEATEAAGTLLEPG